MLGSSTELYHSPRLSLILKNMLHIAFFYWLFPASFCRLFFFRTLGLLESVLIAQGSSLMICCGGPCISVTFLECAWWACTPLSLQIQFHVVTCIQKSILLHSFLKLWAYFPGFHYIILLNVDSCSAWAAQGNKWPRTRWLQLAFLCCQYYLFAFESGSPVVQPGLKLPIWPRGLYLLNSSSSLPSAVSWGLCHHSPFMWCWALNLGLYVW